MAALYSAADLTLVPSFQESFGQMASESLACETPVVAFRCSGLLDIVDHGTNGYLAAPFDAADLAYGVCWALSDARRYGSLALSARHKAEAAFDGLEAAKSHLRLYRELLEEQEEAQKPHPI